jgi:hypothetical protein
MSYDPSHGKPPRQERWPQATPPDGWPSYRDGETPRDERQADGRYAADRQVAYPATAGHQRQVGYQGASGGPGDGGYQSAVATDTFPPARNGYGSAVGYGQADGYGDARDGFDWTENGYGGNGYAAGNANGNGWSDAGNGNGNGTGAFPSGGYAGGINGYAGAADDFAEAANGYGGHSSGYAGTTGGYPTAIDGYADAGDSFAGGRDPFSRLEGGYGQATDEYVSDASGYDWSENGYGSAAEGYGSATDGYVGYADGYGGADGYGSAADGYARAADGYGSAADGYAGTADGFAGSAGYLGPGSYTEPGLSDPMLVAPDAGVDPDRWQADQDLRREASRRGLVVGAVTGFLAAAVAIGVSTLAAGFVRPQASPMAALGSVFIDRMPAALRNAALHHFGTHGRTALLLGMYAAIAVLAVGIGVLARHAAAPGAAALAAFSLLAAFVTITRPGGRVGDVAPAIIGGLVGVIALLWLRQASAPNPGLRPTRGNSRRRA